MGLTYVVTKTETETDPNTDEAPKAKKEIRNMSGKWHFKVINVDAGDDANFEDKKEYTNHAWKGEWEDDENEGLRAILKFKLVFKGKATEFMVTCRIVNSSLRFDFEN